MTDLLALTAELVDVPSVSFNEAPLVDRLERELRQCGHLEVTRIGDNLVARTELNRGQRLVLAGHTDTVPPNGNDQARIEGDTLWGVGSADMKGGLAVFFELARSITEPAVDLSYVFYAREEVAQRHSGLNEVLAQAPELLRGDCAILGEPTGADIEAGCQGTLRLQVHLAGVRAHTARPWMGRNAVHRLAPILAEMVGYEARTPTIAGCTDREAVQAVSVEGGLGSGDVAGPMGGRPAGNVVPDASVLRIHHRYAPDRSAAEAEDWLRALVAPHLDDDDRLVVEDQSPACPPSLDHPLLARLVADNDLTVRAKLGWTDAARFAELGIPATNFGPGDPTVAHAPDEHLDRDSIETVHLALRRLITTPSPTG